MKQLIICKAAATYATGKTYNDLSTFANGAIGLFKPSDGSLISTAAELTENFAVVYGRGTDKAPIHFPEVDVKSLKVEKATYQAGSTFTAKITVPTTVKGSHYTIIIAKRGVVFNERNRFTVTSMAKGTAAADVASDLVKQINANTYNSGVSATSSAGVITITAKEIGTSYEVIGADELTGVAPTSVTTGKKAMLDKAYIQDLASRCAAGKGFNYLAEDGKEIYPGYPETVDSTQYVMYTLRFAVPRVAAKQRDEVVYQILHIAVPVGSTAITTLDAIFGDTMATALTASEPVHIEAQ